MAKYHGYPNATDDGHEHQAYPYEDIETPWGVLAVECARCGLRGDASIPMAVIDEHVRWETE